MATIKKRGDRWFAQVRKRGHSTSKSHPTKAAAQSWATEIEAQIERGEYGAVPLDTLADLIVGYRKLREDSGHPIAPKSNDDYLLSSLSKRLGSIRASDLSVQILVEYAQRRKADGVSPYTVNMELSKLGTIIRQMKSVYSLRIHDVVSEARPALRHLGLIGTSRSRKRRPDIEEVRLLLDWFAKNQDRSKVPMGEVIIVSMTAALRRGELFRILWSDLDEIRRLVLVRDRKDPRNKEGNHQWVPLLPEAWEVVVRRPRGGDRIFPFHPQTVSKLFKKACDEIGIKDLRLHDLRHEATSALFEAGWSIPDVALVTGHKNWSHLKRYTNLAPESVHANVVPISKARKAAG